MRVELSRAEQEKAIALYLEKSGINLDLKTIKCKFSRETVVVDIDDIDYEDLKPTKNLDEAEKQEDTNFFEE